MSELKVAFEMRLSEMNPLKHVQLAYNVVSDTAFNNDVIAKYRKIIKLLVLKERDFIESGKLPEGLHPIVAGFPTGFFAYLFDPIKAKKYLTDHEIQPIKLPTKQLIRYIDQQQLDPINRFEEYDKNAPIIILDSPLFNHPFCICGNLNIAEAKRMKKGKLNVYYLFTDDYLHLMFDDLSKAMHMFHMDLHELSDNAHPRLDELYISKINDYITI
ncbi:hypothetical protein NDS46_31535 (plasmid) [Paenibacillus thiaminolyticus]|uniref:hypothetical protein n=1 Tax=Paenibacillus thiaminolyticus TaxID=49283 RepID=UPI0023308393|nr:hypothetical protein [Paenibacillus thiaminolyticus]WCF11491.1 hypothetical protein NDS46_31535 [Paenibacillus thiaminolyticus]